MRNFRLNLLAGSIAAGMILTGCVGMTAMASSEEVEVILGEDIYEEGDEDDSPDSGGTYAEEDNGETTPSTEAQTTPATEPATTPATEAQTTPATEPATTPATEAQTTPATEPATTPATEAPKTNTNTGSGSGSNTSQYTNATSGNSGSSDYSSSTSSGTYSETTTISYETSDDGAEETENVHFVNFFYDESAATVVSGGEDVLDAEKSARATDGTIVFEVVPADGYVIEGVQTDGQAAETTDQANVYVIHDISAEVTNVTITMTGSQLSENPDEVVLTVNVNGNTLENTQAAVTTQMSETITEGGDYTFSIVPNADNGFTFAEESPVTYSMNGQDEPVALTASEDGSYTIPSAQQNLHIYVNLNNPDQISFFGTMTDYTFGEQTGNSGEGLLGFYKAAQSIQFQLTGNGGLGDVKADQLVLSSLNIVAEDERASVSIPEETGGAAITNMDNGVIVLVTKDNAESWPQYTVSLYTADGSDIEGYIDVETQFSDPDSGTESVEAESSQETSFVSYDEYAEESYNEE